MSTFAYQASIPTTNFDSLSSYLNPHCSSLYTLDALPYPASAFGDDRVEEEAHTFSAYGLSNDDIFLPGRESYLALRRPKKASQGRKAVKDWPDATNKAALAALSARLSTSMSIPAKPTPSDNHVTKAPVATPFEKRLIFSESTNSSVSCNTVRATISSSDKQKTPPSKTHRAPKISLSTCNKENIPPSRASAPTKYSQAPRKSGRRPSKRIARGIQDA